jgi:L-2-hydroxyglutarate oxidase LhgO
MKLSNKKYDVIIIGGGFYGACLALAFRKQFRKVLILEKEAELLTQASYVNQATIHNGYHYPRSYLTALRSKTNFPTFKSDFPEAVFQDYERIYAVSSQHSKVSSRQFQIFCNTIGIPVRQADSSVKGLFDSDMVENVFSVTEYAFNADTLREILKMRLKKAKVEIITGSEVDKVASHQGSAAVFLSDGTMLIGTSQVISCIYGSTNLLLTRSGLPPLPLKHEMTEVALIDVPDSLKKLGITVIDGSFFATMPFPMTKHHSLTHVRYTPQKTFLDGEDHTTYKKRSNFQFMMKDAIRYLPELKKATYKSSLYTIKTVLPQNERDDGRPIMYKKDYFIKNFSVILGGKIDNIYDIFATMKISY